MPESDSHFLTQTRRANDPLQAVIIAWLERRLDNFERCGDVKNNSSYSALSHKLVKMYPQIFSIQNYYEWCEKCQFIVLSWLLLT